MVKKIQKGSTVLHNAIRFAKVAQLLDIPVISSRQQKQGQICSELTAIHGDSVIYQKTSFSMYQEPLIKDRLNALNEKKCAVLYGGETHVAISQTCLDMLAGSYQVFVVVDATSSYYAHDRNIALQRLRDLGAQLVTFQSVLFELQRTFEHPKAKNILMIVKDQPTQTLDIYETNQKHQEKKFEKHTKSTEEIKENKQEISAQVWDSRRQHLKAKKEIAKSQGVEEYSGGGFHEDSRWKKEEDLKDEDGNVKRLDFMKKLKLAPFTALESQANRVECPKCKKSCKYYCYICMCAVMETSEFPKLDLPISVTVISHPKEKKSKSSIIPSKIICPNQVEIVSATEAPELRSDSEPEDSVVLLFPSDTAKEMTQMTEAELRAIKRVVLIDSTWNQTRAYLKQPNIAKLKMVKIQTEKTVFWRYQTGELDTSLATIEALYFFFRDYEVALNCPNRSYDEYKGTYDNILWFYAFNFKLIQDEYTKGSKQDKTFRRIPGYIQENPDKIFKNQQADQVDEPQAKRLRIE